MQSPLRALQGLLNERQFRPFFLTLDRGEHVVVSDPTVVELLADDEKGYYLNVIGGPIRLSAPNNAIKMVALLGADEGFASDKILFSKHPLPVRQFKAAEVSWQDGFAGG